MNSKSLLLLLAITVAGFLRGQEPMDKLLGSESLLGASLSVQVIDLGDGTVLDSKNESEMLCPASVWKLFTTFAALEAMGPEFRFRTQIGYDGILRNGLLEGDLIVVGSGDPSIGSRHFGSSTQKFTDNVVNFIRNSGIDSITGKVIVNAAHFSQSGIPPTRTWEDIGNYYGSGAYGFNIGDNTYEIHIKVPSEPNRKAEILEIEPRIPGLEIKSEVLSSKLRGDRAYIFGAPFSSERIVRGTLPTGSNIFTIKGSIPNPAEFGAYQIAKALSIAAIGNNGYSFEAHRYREISALKIIHTIESPPLYELIEHTNRWSDNLFAEALLLQVGVKVKNSSLEGGLNELRELFESLCSYPYTFFGYDGSGLSRFTAVSAEQVTCLLRGLWLSQDAKVHIINELPVAGEEGTMKWFGRNTNLSSNLKAKSGSMEGVKAYAGTFKALSGRSLAFAILVNNYHGSTIELRKDIENYLLLLYGDY